MGFGVSAFCGLGSNLSDKLIPAQRLLIVVSAPSGAGKTTLCHRLCELTENLCYSISVTTRPPRPGEVNGHDYYFVTEQEFRNKIANNEFLEWAQVHNFFYGTSRQFVENCFAQDKDVILDIDVQGGLAIRSQFKETVLIFVLPPSWSVLKSRLTDRGKDSKGEIIKRLTNAKKEIDCLAKYDYLVINDQLDKAVQEIQAIVVTEHCKIIRRKSEIAEWTKGGDSG